MPHLGIGSQAGKLPGAPTGISASQAGGATAVDVAFTAPTHKGKSGTITNYAATASPGGATASGTASPITFNNLSAGTEYNFNVEAVSAIGNTNFTGSSGASSTGYTPVVPNIAVPTEYNTTTTYTPNSYPFAFKVAAIGAGGGDGNSNSYYSRVSNNGPWGTINNSLAGGSIGAGGGGSGRVHYINTTQTINSGTIVMTVGTGGATGASGGATNVYLNQNAANVATANGGSSGAAITQGNSNATPQNAFNANATTGSGGAGGSGGGTGSVLIANYNDYGTNKGGTTTVYTNGGTAGNAGGSGGATSNGSQLGNGAWKSGTGGAASGNTGTNANSQIPSGGGNSPATSQITISATNYLTDKGRGGGNAGVSGSGAVLLIPA